MGRADYLRLGDWNARCSMCNAKRKASELVRNWQGMYRCPEHNEPRQPQDFVRGVPENQTPPWTQDIPTDVFTFGVLLTTESSNDSTLDPVFYISTETLYPLSTET